MINQKGFAMPIAFVVAGFLLLGSGALFAYSVYEQWKVDSIVMTQSQPQPSTKNWLTYKNDSLGYELKYPSTWLVKPNADETVSLLPPNEQASSDGAGHLFLTVAQVEKINNVDPIISRNTFDVNGLTVTYQKEQPFSILEVFYFPYKTQFISLTWDANDIVNSQTNKAIVDSVRLSDSPQQKVNSINWKTYTNQEAGYSFKYPSKDWQVSTTTSGIRLEYIHGWCQPECHLSMTIKRTDDSLKDFITKLNSESPDFAATLAQELYILGNKQTIKISGRTAFAGDPQDFIFFSSSQKNYVISVGDDISDLALSTFKFTDSTANPKIQPTTSKQCQTDADCGILICSGCFNKQWLQSAPSDLACRAYEGFDCSCQNAVCTAVRK